MTRTSPIATALVTGAGAGTGREYVRMLLADNVRVIAVSLLGEELAQLQAQFDPTGDHLITKQADLSEPEAAEKLAAWCDEHGYEVDTLINNAGFAAYGNPTEIDLSRIEQMLLLNVMTSTKLSMIFGSRMSERGRGRILVMGSSAGFSPTVRFAAYGASKAYTNTFSLALGADLEKHGVSLTCVAPGAFKSNFAAAANVGTFPGRPLMQRIYANEKLDARAVADAGYRAMLAGKPMITVGSKGYAAKLLARALSPVFLARRSRLL